MDCVSHSPQTEKASQRWVTNNPALGVPNPLLTNHPGFDLLAVYNVRCQQTEKMLSGLVTDDPLLCHFIKNKQQFFFSELQ